MQDKDLFPMKSATLLRLGYFVGPRDPKINPEYSGVFMVRDQRDGDDGYAIVGDDIDDLVNEAYEHLMPQANYGQLQCVIILVAEKMKAVNIGYVAEAKLHLSGRPCHPMIHAAISREAADFHNTLTHDQALIDMANSHVKPILIEYGFHC